MPKSDIDQTHRRPSNAVLLPRASPEEICPSTSRFDPSKSDQMKVLNEIERWQSGRRRGSFIRWLSRVGDLVCSPIDRLVDITVPDALLEKAILPLQGILSALRDSSSVLVQERGLLDKAREAGLPVEKIEDFRAIPIVYLDVLARSCMGYKAIYTALQGACLGLGGQALSVLDFPALFLVNLKMIFQIGLCYGYRPDSIGEKELALRIVSLACSSEDERAAELQALEDLLGRLADGTFSPGANLFTTRKQRSAFVTSQVRRYMKWRVSRRLPIVGVLIGFGSNFMFTREVATCAYMVYRKRFLEEKEMAVTSEKARRRILLPDARERPTAG